jgi:two-component system, chemotaxis family, protein-glutamate methylesterase/glutaminase
MTKIRVLVVDDSVVIRKLISDGLAKDPLIEICGSAANGRIALQKIPQCNPDLVTMDIEMPDLDGISAVRELRKTYPKLPVIMVSTLTERGAAATLAALSAGASDYVTKPANVGALAEGAKRIQDELLPKIKSLCGRDSTPPPVPRKLTLPAPSAAMIEPPQILAIGCSTGGPNALAEVIPALPGNLPVPVVIVQHMPPVFTRMLAERLTANSKLRVVEARPGLVLEPGLAVIAPGDFHMTIERKGVNVVVALNQQPHENSCRPAVDPLFRSVAKVYGPAVLSVILTGMGQDGLRGCEWIREAGGQVLAQDEASSVVWGMPGFVVKAGLAHRVLPLDSMAPEITRRLFAAGSSRPQSRPGVAPAITANPAPANAPVQSGK